MSRGEVVRGMRALWLLLFLCAPVWAQTAGTDDAGISIDAKVKAKSVRFDQVPNVRVTFPGHGQRDTRWTAQRKNLPKPLKPGVTYKNVEVTTQIRSKFKNESSLPGDQR